MELYNSDFWMLNYTQQIFIKSNKKEWKQNFKMKKSQSVYIENMRIPAIEDLLLYYNPFSFCSQKVLMALYEKNIPFRSRIIDVTRGEQYDKWFLQISPTGEIPVLQDGNRIIAYAKNIINYIDEWYTTDSNVMLIPNEMEDLRKVTHFRNIIDGMPETILTVGSFIHTSIEEPKPPFSHSMRQQIINGEQNASIFVYQKAESYPEFSGSLLRKASFLQARHEKIINKKEFYKVLSDCYLVLDQIEAELTSRPYGKRKFWLVNETFGAADISLAVFLERIYRIGLFKLFWGNGKRPNIELYYHRVRKRKSFVKAMPSSLMNLKIYGITACLAYFTGVVTCALGLIFSMKLKGNLQLQMFK